MKYAIVLLLLSGCADLVKTSAPYVTPAITLELCDEVNYHRKGLDVMLAAQCKVPVK